MARRGRTSSAYPSRIATRSVPRFTVRLSSLPVAVSQRPRSFVYDARSYHPLGRFRPLAASPRSAARIVVKNPRAPFRVPDVLGFAVPEHVKRCVQRKDRREVLFALRRTGKGARSKKHRNLWSSVSCK